jgi:uroporphyrinogen-III synthase
LRGAHLAAADDRPLAGLRVVVTRAREQAGELIEKLSALGAEVIPFPLLEFAPAEDCAPLDAAIRSLSEFDWLLFTSQNAVRYFVERMHACGLEETVAAMSRPQIAAVGPMTADAVRRAGFTVERVAGKGHGAGLAEDLRGELSGKRVLLPRSDRGRPDLPAALHDAGAEVVAVVAYRTVAPSGASGEAGNLERLLCGEFDVISFASPSAFHSLEEQTSASALQALSERVAFAAIGPVTAAALRGAGMRVALEAADLTAAGLVEAIVNYQAETRRGRS